MELLNFAEEFPDVFAMLNDNVDYIINEYNLNSEASILDIDNMTENLMDQLEANDSFGFNTLESQQIGFGRSGEELRRRRRRFRDFNVRDILRLMFFRNLFDRRRRR